MSRCLQRVVSIAAMGTLAVALFGAPAQASVTGGVAGTVTSFDTGEVIAGACVTLFRTTVEEEVASACTDAAGHYELGGAPPDAYKMRIRASGYADQWAYRKRTWQEAAGVYVSDSWVTTVDVAMWSGTGTVRGQLVDENGNPFPFARITLIQVDRAWEFSTYAENGSYALQNVPVGSYKVEVYSNERGTQYAHGRETFEEADVFAVANGQETVVNEQLLPMGTVEVTMTDAVTGAPVTRGCVRAPGPQQPSSCENVNGVVTVRNVSPGFGTVYVLPEGTHFSTQVDAEIRRGEVTRIAVALQPGAAIVTRIIDRQTQAPLSMCVKLLPTLQRGLSARMQSWCSGADGRLVIGPFSNAGTYRLFAFDTSGQHGAQWLADFGGTGDARYATLVTTQVGTATTAPDIRMDRAGSITGTVRDQATGAPLSGICTYPYAHNPLQGTQFGANCSNAEGRYTITGLGPYKWPVLFTSLSGYAWRWSGDRPNRFDATRVQVTAGGTATMDANMVREGVVTGRTLTASGQPEFGYINPVNARTGDFAGPNTTTQDFMTGMYELRGLGTQDLKIEYRISGSTGDCWYRMALTFETAQVIRVVAGQTKTGIDLKDCHSG